LSNKARPYLKKMEDEEEEKKEEEEVENHFKLTHSFN
jgi:hypothetical protein